MSKHAKHIVIIGGGFLGSELAWSVSKRGMNEGRGGESEKRKE